ncbi:rhamnogalacturonan I rhamnosyltransferase [Marchantia polymorpha subsp. ruderalis]|uniref:O-fucosyltransferase family protein n=4 Tax=Marchantia polymorpha TaxID=3197 RepID=A0AAF6AQE4_MARPO|nr:hypothetical protein MARPO_0033s0138 [Marchantia polymorpha]BBM98664.1 hypothetical protein Mp_1g15230 [Marchantia polymorpha subsp. ruderalis]|eukprot:PTQ41744.1 hypothetical protein MARPO_0033s0138 [Marchantia polymorpha]
MLKGGIPSHSTSNGKSKEWWQEVDLKSLAGQLKAGKVKPPMLPRSRMQVWFIRASTSIFLWTCLIQLTTLKDIWQPQMLRSCFEQIHPPLPVRSQSTTSPYSPSRLYKSNGFLMVSCNGGLNQMRAAICDMVAISKHMNVTLVLPELDKTSFWADPSDFGDIFDVDHFISSLKDDVHIVRELPEEYARMVAEGNYFGLPPVSWSNQTYYSNQILPLVQKYEVVRLNKTDSRLANNGLPLAMQKLRCHVNYHALRFTPRIEELGRRLVQILRGRGPFLVLHLRYEMDMLAFSGCTHGCTDEEADQLTKMRYAYPWWKEKVILSDQKRKDGFCPLTPEETALILRALGYDRDTQIYIAAGEIYGSDRRMAALHAAFPNVVRKEMLLSKEELRPFVNRSSQMASLDYLVSLASDVFIPTYDGNMAKVVEGHRRYLGFRTTILLDRKRLVELLDAYESKQLQWDEFSLAVRQVHEGRMGSPLKRRVVPGRPKEEDYFYSNPQECLCDEPSPSSRTYSRNFSFK